MPSRTFATRLYWHNTLLVICATPFLMLIGVLVLAVYGNFAALITACSIVAIGLPIALMRDIGDRCFYTFKGDRLLLESGRSRKEIPIDELIDASLVDRLAAREYIRQRVAARSLKRKQRRAMINEMVRYCSVDIGLTTFTFGVGRTIIDRLPMARYDLVLLRTKQGDHLISPRYTQDLVETVSRMISTRPAG